MLYGIGDSVQDNGGAGRDRTSKPQSDRQGSNLLRYQLWDGTLIGSEGWS